MVKSRSAALVVLAAVVFVSTRALAVVSPDGARSSSIRVMTSPPPPGSPAAAAVSRDSAPRLKADLAASSAWQRFAAESGPGWTAQWNSLTGAPHLATGPAVAISGYPKLTRENIKQACGAFLSRNSELLRADLASLRMRSAVNAGGRWYVTYSQTVNGVPVVGGTVRMSFTKDDRLVMFGSDTFPGVSIDTTPKVDAKTVLRVAEADCAADASMDRISAPELCILPEPTNGGYGYKLCWRTEILQPREHRKWRYFIDATDGAIAGRWDVLWYGSVSGTVLGEYKPEFENDPTQIDAMRHIDVSAEGPEDVITSWNMDSDPGWTLEGQWQYGKPTGGGTHSKDPTSGHTGTNVLGYNLAGDYPNNLGATYYATSPTVNCTGRQHVRLRFYRWLGMEEAMWDKACIQASNDGVTWVDVWKHDAGAIDDSTWTYVDYDLSAVADNQPAVRVRFGLGPTDTSVTYPGWNIDDVKIVSVQGGVNSTSTLSNGSYQLNLPWDLCGFTSKLEGRFCDINYGAGGDAWFTMSGVGPGSVVGWTWDSSLYSKIDEPNVYRHINYIHDYYKLLDPGFSGLDYPVPALVAVPSYANAYWDGIGVTFGAGDGVYYGNFGLSSEIIYHEYTHGVTDKIYTDIDFPYSGEPGAMNEGWSDYFGCILSLSGTPKMGDGGVDKKNPDGFRTLVNGFRRETDWYGEVHEDSQMFSGALWEARSAIGGDVMDTLVHFARYAHAATFEDELIAILIEDDTRYGDSNIANGTPHGQAIYSAFARHGLGGLRYSTASLAVDDSAGNGNGRLDPGESVLVSVSLTNGWANATNIRGTLTTSDPYVTITKASAAFPDVSHGAAATNAADRFAISLRSDCPDTHTIPFTLQITADGPYAYSRTSLLSAVVAVGQVAHDDGQMDQFTAVYPGDGLCTRLTPSFYPCFPTHIRLMPYDNRPGVISIWDDNGAEGSPGTLLKTVSVSPSAGGDWYDVDISSLGITIDSGSIYVGWIGSNSYYTNGLDMDPPDEGRGWYYQNATKKWYPNSGNLMIRLRYVPPGKIGALKAAPEGAVVNCVGNVVTASFPGFFYVEEPNRSSGIRVEMPEHGASVGVRMTVTGIAHTNSNGERCILATKMAQSGEARVEPIGLTNAALGGAALGAQGGIWHWMQPLPSLGLNNIGLLVRTWGMVTAWGRGWFYVDDGSRVRDGSGNVGIYVSAPGVVPPPTGSVVGVTGISSCEYYNGELVNVLLVRGAEDITVMSQPRGAPLASEVDTPDPRHMTAVEQGR